MQLRKIIHVGGFSIEPLSYFISVSFASYKDESWEGTLSGFIASFVIRFLFCSGIACRGAFGMLAWAVNKHNNIAIPYAALAAMYLAQYAII